MSPPAGREGEALPAAGPGADRGADRGAPLAGGVVLAVEQLRRSVPGGVGTYALGLLQGLRELGPAAPPLRLLASRPPTCPDPLGRLGWPLVTSPLPAGALVRAWGMGLAGVGGGPALVHAVSLAAPPSLPPLVVAVHDLAWRTLPEGYPRRGRRWHEAALQRAAHRAAAFVVPSAPVAAALVEARVGVGADRVAVVPEGADHLPPPDLEGARATLRRLGVGEEFLLAVGTLEPRKNLRRLLAAYGLARPGLPEPWPLVVVGPRGWGEALGPCPPGVVLAGRVGDAVLAGCYALARCCAYVPLLEGFGLPVVEAMAAGCPVVASPVPSAAGAALEVDPLDQAAIADGLVRAAADPAERSRLVAAGLSRTAGLTWARSAALHLDLWDRVAEGTNSGAGR